MQKKPIVPFRLLPGSWGLRGQTYLRAKAEYELSGEDLERRLLEIDFDGDVLADKLLDVDLKYHRRSAFEVDCIREKADEDWTGAKRVELEIRHARGNPYRLARDYATLVNDDEKKREIALLDVELEYEHISDKEHAYQVDLIESDADADATGIRRLEVDIRHERGDPYELHKKIADLTNDNDEDRQLALLDVEYAYKRIDDLEYEKRQATIRNEPWIGIVDHGYNPDDGINGLFMQFDWNVQWIAFLRANGYNGKNEDEIVERWFQDINNHVANDDIEFGYNFVDNLPRGVNRVDRGDGSSDYH